LILSDTQSFASSSTVDSSILGPILAATLKRCWTRAFKITCG